MEIRYLTPTHNAQAGGIQDINEAQANVLILLKIAEKYAEEPQKTSKIPHKTTTKG
uniref:Uncharacterized protein n=1 Tax=Siphoviridae sp. ctEeW6 TaxID=2827816 RepID=A0A8S5T1G2_9CAUD|nr:MAG TPA: hypothetical protein [Siphoviridae sp. ctEeW6]